MSVLSLPAVQSPIRRLKPVAVIDTNVVMEINSCADLQDALKNGHPAPATPEGRLLAYRLTRLRDSLVLGWHLHANREATYSLAEEGLRTLMKLAPPEDVQNFGVHYTVHVLHFVKEVVLRHWHDGTAPGVDAGINGSACDDLLIEIARRVGVPLISYEGYSHESGARENPKGMRAKARSQNVVVLTPQQFWRGKIGRGRACREFLRRMDREASKYLRQYRPQSSAYPVLNDMRRIYQEAFFARSAAGYIAK